MGNDSEKAGGAKRALMAVIQIAGFLGGVGLLVWVVSAALSPENRALLTRLGDATGGQLAALLALSVATLVLNGSIFWVTLLPVKRVGHTDIQATNAIATLLSYLPFKLGLIFRIVVHNRRDGVPLLTIGAWYLAIGMLVLTNLGPPVLASLWRGGVDAWWWVAALGGAGALTGSMVLVCIPLSGERGMARIHRWLDPVPVSALHRFMRTESFARLHAGFGMLAHARASFWATLMRLADIGVQTARFVIAAQVLGIDLGWEAAVLIATTYFMIGMLSPFGMIGTREGGTLGLQTLLGVELVAQTEGDPLALIVLFVSATESIAYFVGAGFGVVWLRADRLLMRRASEGGENVSSPDADRPGPPEPDRRRS
ncbi:MAG: hypothetical protein ACIARR_09245 [Phycisphaerales bacterium JB059]